MDNNNYETRRPRKKVTKKMAQRRRLAAVGILLLALILLIVLICKACSKDDDDTKGNNKTKQTQPTTVTTAVTSATTRASTTTTVPRPTADPNDPNVVIEKIELDKYSIDLEVGGENGLAWVTMTPDSATEEQKAELWETSDKTVATVDEWGHITPVGAGECIVTVSSKNNPAVYAQVKVRVTDPNGQVSGAAGQTPSSGSSTQTTTSSAGGFQQTANGSSGGAAAPPAKNGNAEIKEVNGMTYVNGVLIANKSYGLPSTYNPGLDPTTQSQFDVLSSAAAKEGLNIWLASGFRSYDSQDQIYNNYVDNYGAATADTFSARPGYSEHQTGLAIDVNSIDDSFAGTPEAVWLENHAHEYGFIIRYPKGKENITGYKYEPWHIRYLGVETATAVYKSGLTLEEYFGIDSSYKN